MQMPSHLYMYSHSLLHAHAEALAQQLGRPAAELRAKGLRAPDFSDSLSFKFQDGSHATFNYALFVHAAQTREIAVFTEHCGYFTFPDYVKVYKSGEVVFNGLEE